MDRKEVKALFLEGIKDFDSCLPIPENRVKAMGWRHGKFVATQLELSLDTAYETFCEVRRSISGEKVDTKNMDAD